MTLEISPKELQRNIFEMYQKQWEELKIKLYSENWENLPPFVIFLIVTNSVL